MNISETTLAKLKEHRSDYQKARSKWRKHPYIFWMNQAAIELGAQNLPERDIWNHVVEHLVTHHEWAK
jgi:hypothetical protein